MRAALGCRLLTLGAALLAAPAAASAQQVFLTLDEALELAFPDCTVTKSTAYLDEDERKQAAAAAGQKDVGRIVRPYVARRDGKVVGTAYVDTHRVRAMKETLLIVVGLDDTVSRLEILAFGEPVEYVPRADWYQRLLAKPLDDELQLKRSVPPVAGATLTARATTDAVRRTLAVHAVLQARSREDAPLPVTEPKTGDGPPSGRRTAA